jgi:hypothetical protein
LQYQKKDSHHKNISFVAKAGIFFIKGYQKWISPMLGSNCRFRPTCSQYTLEAIEKYGLFKGGAMGLWRILRCNPFSKGGDDPVR